MYIKITVFQALTYMDAAYIIIFVVPQKVEYAEAASKSQMIFSGGKNMSTYMPKAADIHRKWYVIDASGKSLGRVASAAAVLLRGKHKTDYVNYLDCGDHVIIVNAEKAVLTGHKLDRKIYRHHTGYPGGLKEVKYRTLMSDKPEKAVMLAVKGMLPPTVTGRSAFSRLRVYRGESNLHDAQKPEKWDI